MKQFVSAILVVLLVASNAGLANAQPHSDETFGDIVNFWEQASLRTD
ncbi:MAG: hypothetical protein KTR19_05550 [Hyphomicrobiales bacterium]|nr:hypothetical protein [Hyphomicrobiales bacterium]